MSIELFKRIRRRVKDDLRRFRDWRLGSVETIDLRRALCFGEMGHDAWQWAERTGDLARASLLLAESPHVRTLRQYEELGEALLEREHLEQTPYFMNAMLCVDTQGHYFGVSTYDELRDQTRAFLQLYKRIKEGDPSEVAFADREGHTIRGTLPMARRTWTPDTFQINDGMHRLAAHYLLENFQQAVTVYPAEPTRLQALVAASGGPGGERRLRQPIPGPEFDRGWDSASECERTFAAVLNFLANEGIDLEGLSAVDLNPAYGWNMAELAKHGCRVVGVTEDSDLVLIGQTAYRLPADRFVYSDLKTYLARENHAFDVALLLDDCVGSDTFADNDEIRTLVSRLAKVAERVVFLEVRNIAGNLAESEPGGILAHLHAEAGFSRVVSLPTDTGEDRSLYACVR